DLVDQSHVKRLLRIVLIAQVPDLPCFLLSHNAGQVRRAKPAVEATHLRSGLAEACVLGGNGQVAHDVQDMAAAYGPPGDSRDDGFRNRANEFLQVEDVEPRDGVLPDVAALTTHTLIIAATSGNAPSRRVASPTGGIAVEVVRK